MGEGICELCEYRSQLGAVEKHHVIPEEITEQAGIPKPQILKMCCNCRRELATWYSAKVTEMVYDTKMQCFRARARGEMVEEYQSVFSGFVNYKKREPLRYL
ncbi:hypothetical protein ACFLUO_09780 [Chloroflexota bacterium]